MRKLQNDTFLKAIYREPTPYTPIWIMRQAGRYLPEYRQTRAKAGDFLTLCKTPELACEVTLQPLSRFNLDAAIVFSDILTIPDAMGLGLYFVEGEGPKFASPINSIADIAKLAIPDPNKDLKYVCDAIRLCQQKLDGKVPLIGFSGSPWTLATYMVEGESSKNFYKIKNLLYTDPKHLHVLLDKLAQAVASYLQAQIDAGADALMLFDTWGGMLTTANYREFSLNYMQQINQLLKRQQKDKKIPLIVFTKGGGLWLDMIAEIGCDAVGLDWTIDIGQARNQVGNKVALQGNLDPSVLMSTPDVIRTEVAAILKSYGKGSGHIFNLGHGITPNISPENVTALVDAVHELSALYHQ